MPLIIVVSKKWQSLMFSSQPHPLLEMQHTIKTIAFPFNTLPHIEGVTQQGEWVMVNENTLKELEAKLKKQKNCKPTATEMAENWKNSWGLKKGDKVRVLQYGSGRMTGWCEVLPMRSSHEMWVPIAMLK